MTALTISPFAIFTWPRRTPRPLREDVQQSDSAQRKEIVSHMISAGACESEYGVQMLMAVFPDQY